jgi:arylformamidase
MKVIDLSHKISEDMPVFPGTLPPKIKIESTIAEDGFREREITMFSHVGTHIDAPAHVLASGKTLDQFPIAKYAGSCCVVNLARLKSKVIDLDFLIGFHCIIEKHDFVLLMSNWSQKWSTEAYYQDYPVLHSEAAEWLTGFPNIKGIGVDASSIDGIESKNLENHKILLEKDIIIVENLNKLDTLPVKEFSFSCFPLKHTEADGSPVRAVAYVS